MRIPVVGVLLRGLLLRGLIKVDMAVLVSGFGHSALNYSFVGFVVAARIIWRVNMSREHLMI